MTLPASGAISFNAINVELGVSGTTQASLGQASYRTLAGVASGAISMSNFYGKSNSLNVAYLVVAGGGAGGQTLGGGGGGAGAQRYVSSANLAGGAYAVTVGGGGAGVPTNTETTGNNGSNSVFSSTTSHSSTFDAIAPMTDV